MPLTKVTHPMTSYLASSTPTFTEDGDTLYRDTGFDNEGNVTIIPASKQYNYIGIRNGGSFNEFEVGDNAMVTGLSYYMKAKSTSNATSNMYAVIGNIYNAGPGTTKALYARVSALSGCTGNVVASTVRTQIDTGATPAASWCMQIGPAGDIAYIADAVIEIDHEQGTTMAPGQAQYGILQAPNIEWTQAMIRGINGGGGDFLRWQSSSAILFTVNDAGDVETATKFKVSTTELSSESLKRTATGGNFGVHLDAAGSLYIGGTDAGSAPMNILGSNINIAGTSARLNFVNLSAGSAGSIVGYVTIKVDGTDRKLAYYAV